MTPEDKHFIDYIYQRVEKADGGEGDNDWIRNMFSEWTKSCLSVAVDSVTERPISAFSTFNKDWVSEWTSTGNPITSFSLMLPENYSLFLKSVDKKALTTARLPQHFGVELPTAMDEFTEVTKKGISMYAILVVLCTLVTLVE